MSFQIATTPDPDNDMDFSLYLLSCSTWSTDGFSGHAGVAGLRATHGLRDPGHRFRCAAIRRGLVSCLDDGDRPFGFAQTHDRSAAFRQILEAAPQEHRIERVGVVFD